jgi:HPr kinase/phosphorylase
MRKIGFACALRVSLRAHSWRLPVCRVVNLHASAVAVGGKGLLILGPSGAGKSGLALRLMALGAELVADDRVLLERRGAGLVAKPPDALAGLIEARGIGLVRVANLPESRIVLAVDLAEPPAARLPHLREITWHGVAIELISGAGAPNLHQVLYVILQGGRVQRM